MSRIAFISTLESTAWGGSEELWFHAAQHLIGRGHTVGASVHWWPQLPGQIQTLQQSHCHLVRRQHKTRLNAILGSRFASRHEKWLDRFRPDVAVISLDGHGRGLAWMNACARRSIPYLVVVHAVTEHYWPDDQTGPALARAYQNAQAVSFVSNRNKELVCAQLGQEFPNSGIVRNPFSVAYDAAPEWPQQTDSFHLACVGRLDPAVKGHDILFEVLRQPKWRERPLHVTLYGSGAHEQTLRSLKAKYQLDKVSFGGFIHDVESIWKTHHGLILSSRVEGLPIVIVEAMLCGRLCIVTDIAGNAELLNDGTSGFVAAAPKAELLDAAMERAWEHRNQWQQMGKQAALDVRRHIPGNPIEVFATAIEHHLGALNQK